MEDYDETVMAWAGAPRPQHLRPDPEPRPVRFRFISVDDHLVEPPTLFHDRLPRRFADLCPRVERRDGVDYWLFEGEPVGLRTTDAHQSWDPSEWGVALVCFDDVRPGTWDIHARIHDMDLGGIGASLNFPSTVFGFAGQRFMKFKDQALGLAAMRAYNDWLIEEWTAPYPDRIIPSQVTWLADAEVAAGEVRRNPERGFKAVAFSENPQRLGLPSLYSDHWEPLFRACEETETVINLHVGSSSETLMPSRESPPQVLGALFPVNAMQACLDWLFAQIPLRFPGLRIVLSESGIGWVPMVIERLRYQQHIYVPEALGRDWAGAELTPEELLRRNFWFTSYYDPLGLQLRHEIGIDRIMLESDYPHADSTWPDSQALLGDLIGSFDPDDIARLTYANAAEVYRHPVPAGAPA